MACGYGACYGCVVSIDGHCAAVHRGAGARAASRVSRPDPQRLRLPRRARGARGRPHASTPSSRRRSRRCLARATRRSESPRPSTECSTRSGSGAGNRAFVTTPAVARKPGGPALGLRWRLFCRRFRRVCERLDGGGASRRSSSISRARTSTRLPRARPSWSRSARSHGRSRSTRSCRPPSGTSPRLRRRSWTRGADGLSLVNTMRGLALDPRRCAPMLARGVGGYSGPALRPIALAACTRAPRRPTCPIVGMGGVSTGRTRSSSSRWARPRSRSGRSSSPTRCAAVARSGASWSDARPRRRGFDRRRSTLGGCCQC